MVGGDLRPMSEERKPTLADLRVTIDRIDAHMHELLIERGRVIDRLIEIKERQGGGSGVPAGAGGRDDARDRRAASRPVTGRYRREHLAGHHLDLHLCPGAL